MNFQYDVALSFSGADREVAAELASIAEANELRVFYDEHYQVYVWGKNLVEELSDIYARQARYCLILISENYLQSAYTKIERRAALDRAMHERAEYILPVVLDDAWIMGLPRATTFFDLRETSVQTVGRALVQKVRGVEVAVMMPEQTVKMHPVEPPPGAHPAHVVPERKPRIPLRFASIRMGEECEAWKEEDMNEDVGTARRSFFSYNLGEDPVVDVTVIHEDPAGMLLIDRVGIEFVRAGYTALLLGGAGGLSEVKRRDTFVLELPDVWALMKDAPGRTRGGGYTVDPIPIGKRAASRLANPLLIQSIAAYRFALVLYDYAQLIPTRAYVRLFVETDRGTVYSDELTLGWLLGGDYAGYARIMQNKERPHPDRVSAEAYQLWEEAGGPSGRDKEFWLNAEQRVLREQMRYYALRPRPLWPHDPQKRVNFSE